MEFLTYERSPQNNSGNHAQNPCALTCGPSVAASQPLPTRECDRDLSPSWALSPPELGHHGLGLDFDLRRVDARAHAAAPAATSSQPRLRRDDLGLCRVGLARDVVKLSPL